MVRVALACAVVFVSLGAHAEAPQLGLLFKTLAYDERLTTRIEGPTVPVLAVGVSCADVPRELGSRPVACSSPPTLTQAIGEASAKPGVLILGKDATSPIAAAVGLAAGLTVLTVEGEAVSESLLSMSRGQVVVGASALKRLGASFPAAVLRRLQVVPAPTMPASLPEFAFPPRPPPDANPGWPAGEKSANATVMVRVGVLESGKVTGVELLKGAPAFAPLALNAVRSWVWEPARLDDKPIASSVVFKVEFHPP